MREHNNPFLSAAAIRRILALHPFSEPNRTYLLEVAERREKWEQEVAALLRGLLTHNSDAPSAPAPARHIAGTDVTHSFT